MRRVGSHRGRQDCVQLLPVDVPVVAAQDVVDGDHFEGLLHLVRHLVHGLL